MSENIEKKEVSLSDLSEGAIPTGVPVGMPLPKLKKEDVKPVNMAEAVLPDESSLPVEGTGNPMLDKAFNGLDTSISRLQEHSNEVYEKGVNERLDKAVTNTSDDNIDNILEKNTSNTMIVHTFDDEEEMPFTDDIPIPVSRKNPIHEQNRMAQQQEEVAQPTQAPVQPVVEAKPEPPVTKQTPPPAPVQPSAPVVKEEAKTVISSEPVEAKKDVEEDAGDNEETKTEETKKKTKTATINIIDEEEDDDDLFKSLDVDDDDLRLLDEDDDDNNLSKAKYISDSGEEVDEKTKTEELRQTIREEMKEKFTPYGRKLNLTQFTIAKKPVNAAKVINEINNKPLECADGVLYSEKRAVRMSALKPMEIQTLDPQRMRSREVNFNQQMVNKLKLVYEHIIDENKPSSFETWAKLTPNTVVNDFMFTAYKATFGTSNILTFNCEDDKCSNIFMEKVPIGSMIKFKDDETKEKYYEILHSGNVNSSNNSYDVNLYQASDNYVFGLKIPSLYDTFIEPTLADRKFMQKYENLLILLTYIDSIYIIDQQNSQLIPVDTKPVASDKKLTYKRRIKAFATIIKSLTSDQLQALSVETDKYDEAVLDDEGELITDIKYIFPERVCPKCGKKITEKEITPDDMLFTRHQLGLMNKI